MKINFERAIFSPVPKGFEKWYLKNSGTFYQDGEWIVDREDFVEFVKTATAAGWNPRNGKFRKGEKITKRVLRAAKFQEDIIESKKIITSKMGKKGGYIIGNTEAFALMRDKKVVVDYEYQGQEYTENISL